MENLHLKNLNINPIKTKIEYNLKSIKTKESVINEFKELYIKNLYNDDYDKEHLIGIAEEMIYIIKLIKDFTTNQKISNKEIEQLEQKHLLLISKYEHPHNNKQYLLQYSTNPEGELDTDYKEISIIINNNIIEEIEYTNI